MMITCGKVRRNNAWHWHILIGGVLLLLQEQATLTLALEEGEECLILNIPGICRTFSDCKILQDAYEQNTIAAKDVTHCGYTIKAELICCPVRWNVETTTDSKTETRDFNSSKTNTIITMPIPVPVPVPTPTPIPTSMATVTDSTDFWLHLLVNHTTAKPLVIQGKELDVDTGFYDLTQLMNSSPTNNANISNGFTHLHNPPLDQIQTQLQPTASQKPPQQQEWELLPVGGSTFQQPRQNNPFHQPRQQYPFSFPNQLEKPTGSQIRKALIGAPNAGLPPIDEYTGAQRNPSMVFMPTNHITEPDTDTHQIDANQLPSGQIFPQNRCQLPGESKRQVSNPISDVNRQLINAGMDIVEAKLNSFDQSFNPQYPLQQQQQQQQPQQQQRQQQVGKQFPHQQRNQQRRQQIQQQIYQPHLSNHQMHLQQHHQLRQQHHQLRQQQHHQLRQQHHQLRQQQQQQRHSLRPQHQQLSNLPCVDLQQAPTNAFPGQSPPEAPFSPAQLPLYNLDTNSNNNFQQLSNLPSRELQQAPTNPFPGQSTPIQMTLPNFDISDNNNNNNNDNYENNYLTDGGLNVGGGVVAPHHTMDPSSTTDVAITTKYQKPAAVEVCERIKSKLRHFLTPHILDGIPADPGEFPHAAVILFNEENARCGGSLIDARFVLTAAHCVKSARRQPVSVRLGLVNLTNTNEGIEIPIARVHLHTNYTGQFKYNDIALIELQRDAFDWETVNWNVIGPACLYTDEFDPPRESKLNVIGWGLINTNLRTTSPILLKAELNITDSTECNVRIRNQLILDAHSSLPNGIIDSQVCAYAAGKDACQGDSGGPLNLVMDEDSKFYKIFGIVSTGFSCGSSTPGLYTRVSSYIEYIESVVWPKSK